MSTWIHRNDRPKRQLPPKHPRLLKLDQDLMKDQSRDFDYINLCGPGFRLRVCVMRDLDGRFFASTQCGKAYRVEGGSPSGAVRMLQIGLHRDLAWMRNAERETLKAVLNA